MWSYLDDKNTSRTAEFMTTGGTSAGTASWYKQTSVHILSYISVFIIVEDFFLYIFTETDIIRMN